MTLTDSQITKAFMLRHHHSLLACWTLQIALLAGVPVKFDSARCSGGKSEDLTGQWTLFLPLFLKTLQC